MNNFELIKANVGVRPFLDEISGVPTAWDLSTGRQDKIAVQKEAKAIPIRGIPKSKIGDQKRRDVQESRWTNTSRNFPLIRGFLEDFAREANSELGRAKVVLLPAGRRVYPHIDRGEYYRLRNRYHLVLQSAAGSWMRSGNEEVRMGQGELWWFDNNQMHEAYNDGDLDRIHFIFDLLPRSWSPEVISAPSETVSHA